MEMSDLIKGHQTICFNTKWFKYSGPVQTYPFLFENGDFLESGDFLKETSRCWIQSTLHIIDATISRACKCACSHQRCCRFQSLLLFVWNGKSD